MATKMKYSLIATHPDNPQPGQLCVWNMTDPPHTISRYAVKDLDEAKSLIRKLTDDQLKDDSIGCNAFGLEIFDTSRDDPKNLRGTGEWVEWESPEDGEDICTVMDAEDAETEEATNEAKG